MYYVDKLVYYDCCEDVERAIWAEKKIKGGSRRKKIEMVNSFNNDWHDLYDEI
jgi:putative endonuclease